MAAADLLHTKSCVWYLCYLSFNWKWEQCQGHLLVSLCWKRVLK